MAGHPAHPNDGRSRWAHYRDRQRGEAAGVDGPLPPSKEVEPCGTWAAVMRHRRNGELPLDEKCAAAESERNAENYRRRRAKKVDKIRATDAKTADRLDSGEISLREAERLAAEVRAKKDAKNAKVRAQRAKAKNSG